MMDTATGTSSASMKNRMGLKVEYTINASNAAKKVEAYGY